MPDVDSQSLRLKGGPLGGLEIDLYPWLKPDLTGMNGVEALEGILGFGLAPVVNRWFEGAGHGQKYRGGKAGPRDIEIPLDISAADRGALNTLLRDLELMLSPSYAPARLSFRTFDGDEWWINVVRESGGDYKRGGPGGNGSTNINTSIVLRAGDPFWIRERVDDFDVFTSAGDPLLPYFAALKIASSQANGQRQMVNTGSSEAWPLWTLTGPATRLVLSNSAGDLLDWRGTLTAGQKIFFDSDNSTAVDSSGVNRYPELEPAPKFWPVLPGSDVATVNIEGVTPSVSGLRAVWSPRRWAMV